MVAERIRKIAGIAVVAGSIIMLGACGGVSRYLGGKDNTDPPAKLVEFKQTVAVRQVWNADIGAGTGKLSFRLKPSIYNNRVFAADYKGKIKAFSLDKGATLWSVDTKQQISSGPASGHGIVVVGTTRGKVLAYNALTGKQVWTAQVSSEVLAAPAISSEYVVVRSIDGVITILKSDTGRQVWRYKRQTPLLSIRGNSAPVVAGDRAYVGFDNGKVVCLDLRKKRLAWEHTATMIRGRTELDRLVDIDADPVIRDGVLYVSTFQGRLVAMDLKSRQMLWSRKMSSFKNIAVDESNVYVTDAKSYVWAFDRQSGRSLWSQKKLFARKVTGPTVLGPYVVVGDYAGYLHWMRRTDGQFVARSRYDSKGYLEPPINTGNMLIVQGRSGEITALKVK